MTTRRTILKGIGAAAGMAAAGPKIAASMAAPITTGAVASAQMRNVGNGLINAGVGRPASSPYDDICRKLLTQKEDAEERFKLRFAFRLNGLEPDLFYNRSMSPTAKMRMQMQRDHKAAAEHRTFSEGIMKKVMEIFNQEATEAGVGNPQSSALGFMANQQRRS